MLAKKHFKAIAEIIEQTFGDDILTEYAPSAFAETLAAYFATQNPDFNREQFLEACGL